MNEWLRSSGPQMALCYNRHDPVVEIIAWAQENF